MPSLKIEAHEFILIMLALEAAHNSDQFTDVQCEGMMDLSDKIYMAYLPEADDAEPK